MKTPRLGAVAATVALCLLGPRLASAQTYDIPWFTVDGGGATFSTGGTYSLGGTIGQPDAGGPATGGSYTLAGGFWPGAPLPADLSVTKTDGQTAAVPTLPITYTIVVSNPGPGATTANVTDTVPPDIVGATWTCSGLVGGVCASGGSGDINDTVTLPVGSSVTYTLTGTVSASSSGVSNTASVSPLGGVSDPDPSNNSATDVDTISPQADLAITKTDGRVTATPGGPVTYPIVAANGGPNASSATVTDTPPGSLSGVSWTCAGLGGGTCGSASGSASINDTATLPVGASVTYTLTGTLGIAAVGSLANTAAVAPGASVTDPVSTNNSATDTDTIVPTNNVAANAKDLLIGSTSSDSIGSAPDDHNWFRYRVSAGRSYCLEVDNGRPDTSVRDPFLSVYHADATTLVGSDDDIADEPGGGKLSRVCYIATASEDNLADVTPGASGTPGGIRVRVVETTLFCPWLGPLFSGSGFESFILIKNTTGTTHGATVTLTGVGGTTLGTPQSGTVPGNGSYNLQVAAAPPTGFGLSGVSAGVPIAHDGPPGSMIANVTTLNFGSGVSYDTPMVPRLDFRP
jgi:uncharacterized repeat protein (TIGR01451 family)